MNKVYYPIFYGNYKDLIKESKKSGLFIIFYNSIKSGQELSIYIKDELKGDIIYRQRSMQVIDNIKTSTSTVCIKPMSDQYVQGLTSIKGFSFVGNYEINKELLNLFYVLPSRGLWHE